VSLTPVVPNVCTVFGQVVHTYASVTSLVVFQSGLISAGFPLQLGLRLKGLCNINADL